MKHILRITGEQTPADMPAAVLGIMSRGRPISGDTVQVWRIQLADAVGDGPLADLLRSPDPIRMAWVADLDGQGGQYEIDGP